MKTVLTSSMDQGMEISENLKEKPKYMLFALLTVVMYIYFGWIGVLGWFVLNVVVDYVLMKKDGEI